MKFDYFRLYLLIFCSFFCVHFISFHFFILSFYSLSGCYDRYVSGEYRFRNGYCRSNPRKMVKTWAEKEMRNLKRLSTVGVPCPQPFLLKSHVLVMEFLGKDGWCAPRLKDAVLTIKQLEAAYRTIVIDMHRMYHECSLVHGDLSEYNLLWYRERPVIIDVSQSVEHAHPYANDFLRKDAMNITDFFKKKGITVLSNYKLFQFITLVELLKSDVMEPEPMDVYTRLLSKLNHIINQVEAEADEDNDDDKNDISISKLRTEIIEKQLIDESVFLQSYIPTSLHEFSNPMAEMQRINKGGREKIHTEAVLNMLGQGGGMNVKDADDDDDEEEDEEDDLDSSSSLSSDHKYHRCLPTHNDPNARALEKEQRKEARRIVKAEAAAKRLVKIPKHIKKKAVKAGSKNKK